MCILASEVARALTSTTKRLAESLANFCKSLVALIFRVKGLP